MFTTALQVNHFPDLEPKLMNNTVSKEDPWLLNNEPTEGRTFNTETETEPTWITEEEQLLLD